ncbi:MAG: tryptophan--tRNA ligase, partial [Myxococcota bacterium]
KMSKSYDNTIRMFWSEKKIKKAVMGIVTDSTPVEEPKDTGAPLFKIWSLFASQADREREFARAKAGGLGYGDVKKDLVARLLDYFAEMRARRADLEGRPDDVEDILVEGAARARVLAGPVLDACRSAAGLRTGA